MKKLILLICMLPLISQAGYWKEYDDCRYYEQSGWEMYVWSLSDFPLKVCLDETYDEAKREIVKEVVSILQMDYMKFVAGSSGFRPLVTAGKLPFQLFEIRPETCNYRRYRSVVLSHKEMEKRTIHHGRHILAKPYIKKKRKPWRFGYVYFDALELLWGGIRTGLDYVELYMHDDSGYKMWNMTFEPDDFWESPSYPGVLYHELMHVLGIPHLKQSGLMRSKLHRCLYEFCRTDGVEWSHFIENYLD